MKLNSKRLAAALVTLAAFTGVLIKDIPFAAKPVVSTEALLPDNSLGDVGLLSTKDETSLPVQNANHEDGITARPSATGATDSVIAFNSSGLSDKPDNVSRPPLPNPVGASAAADHERAMNPFFAASPHGTGGGAGSVGGGGGGNGGAPGGGGAGGGGAGAGGEPNVGGGSEGESPAAGGVTPPAIGGDNNGSNSESGVSKPDVTDDSSPTNHGNSEIPTLPVVDQPTENHGLPPGDGDNLELPSDGNPVVDPTTTPPSFDEPLLDEPGQFPDPQTPGIPTDVTHSVPDGGSTALLTFLAIASLVAIRRK